MGQSGLGGKEQGGVPVSFRLAQPGRGCLGGKDQDLLESQGFGAEGSLSTALVLKVPPENVRGSQQTLVQCPACDKFRGREGSQVSTTRSLPTRHTQSRTHPLSIDAWAKGEVFPGEVLKLDGDWARVTGGRTAHEMQGTAGWRSDGGETAGEMGSPLAGPVVDVCLECEKGAGQGGG